LVVLGVRGLVAAGLLGARRTAAEADRNGGERNSDQRLPKARPPHPCRSVTGSSPCRYFAWAFARIPRDCASSQSARARRAAAARSNACGEAAPPPPVSRRRTSVSVPV